MTRGSSARNWWTLMQPGAPRPDPGSLAQLRRAATPAEALILPATFDLAERLGISEGEWEVLGAIAATLSHVRIDVPKQRMAALLGEKVGESHRLSPLRFQKLMQADGWETRMAALRRAIALAEHRGNISDLAESLLDWSEKTRTRWTFAYFGARSLDAMAAPSAAPDPIKPTEEPVS